jgi:dihydrofolate synthase/folylpolyglutamate synthase
MIADVLKRAGYKTGLYTSPHLVKFNERTQINRKQISDSELSELINIIRNTGVQLTFFEYSTIIAILHFYNQKVDYAVLEVGLGGRLDATNVVDSEIAVITSIGWDHMHILGDTIEKIAKEKVAIIKPKSKVVTCKNNQGLPWIKEAAVKNKLIIANPYKGIVGLRGPFQKVNAGIAYEVCKLLEIPENNIEEGIASVKWPGRMEYLDKNLLVDCAHNLSAFKASVPYVKTLPKRRLIIVFGVLADKDYKKMIKALPKPDFLILTKPPIDRALDPAELVYDGPCAVIADPEEALRYARSIAQPEDLIFVTGSCYLTGKIMEALDKSENQRKASAPQNSPASAQMRP